MLELCRMERKGLVATDDAIDDAIDDADLVVTRLNIVYLMMYLVLYPVCILHPSDVLAPHSYIHL